MARDYKPRNQEKGNWRSSSEHGKSSSVGLWKTMLFTAVVILLAVGLVYIITKIFKKEEKTAPPIVAEQSVAEQPKPVAEVKVEPKGPQFDFYTILPDKEVIVPEYEIKTRVREERVGKAKETHYIMQAGSFKTLKEAEQLHTKLMQMGIDSKIEKSKAGTVNWYLVKMGPYTRAESVKTIQARLRPNGIDAVVTEIDK